MSQSSGVSENVLVRGSKLVTVCSALVLPITLPFAMVPALPSMAREFARTGDGQFLAQMVVAIPSVAILIGAPLGGWAADAIGMRACLLASLLVYTIAGASCLVDPTFDALVVSRLVLGLAAGAAAAQCTALAGVWYEGDRRKRILGYAHAASSLYNMLMLVAGAWLVDHIGWRAPSWFYMIGLTTFICAGIATARSGKPSIGHPVPTGSTKLRSLWPLYLLTFLFAFDACMPLIQGPFLLSGAGWQDATSQSIAIAALLVTAVISSAAYGRLQKIFSDLALVLLVSFSMGIGTFICGALSSPQQIVIGYVIIGIGFGLYVPVITALIIQRTDEKVRARAVGLMTSAMLVNPLVNPVVIAVMRRSLTLADCFEAMGVVFVLIGVAVYALKKSMLESPGAALSREAIRERHG
jgi:ACDE family multidrug resistance protein